MPHRQTRRDSHRSTSTSSLRSAKSDAVQQRLSTLVRTPPALPVEEPPVRQIDDPPQSALGGVARLLSRSGDSKASARRYPPSAPSNARARDLHHTEPAATSSDATAPGSSGSARSFKLQMFRPRRSASIKSQRSVQEHEKAPGPVASLDPPSQTRRRSSSPARPAAAAAAAAAALRKRSFDAASMLLLRKRSSDPSSTPATQLPASWTERRQEAKTILRTVSPRSDADVARSSGKGVAVSFSPATAPRNESRTLEDALREGSWSSDWSPTVIEHPADVRSTGSNSTGTPGRSPTRSLPRSPGTSRLARPATSDGTPTTRSPLGRDGEFDRSALFATLPNHARPRTPFRMPADTASIWTQSSDRSKTGSHVASPLTSQASGWTAEPDPLYIGRRIPRPALLQIVQDESDDSPSVAPSSKSRSTSTSGSARESMNSRASDQATAREDETGQVGEKLPSATLQHSTSVSERLSAFVSSAASAVGRFSGKSAVTPTESSEPQSSASSLHSQQRSPSKAVSRTASAPSGTSRRPMTAPHDAGRKPLVYIPNHLTREDVNKYIDSGLRSPLLAALSEATLSGQAMHVDQPPMTVMSVDMPLSSPSNASSVDPRDTSRLSAVSPSDCSRLSVGSTDASTHASSRTGDMYLSANSQDEYAQPGPFERAEDEPDRVVEEQSESDSADEAGMTPRARELPLLDLSCDSRVPDQSYDAPEQSPEPASAEVPSPLELVSAVRPAPAPASAQAPSTPSTPSSPQTAKSGTSDGGPRAKGASFSSSRMLFASKQRMESILSAGPQPLRGFKARRPQEAQVQTPPKRTTRQRLLSLFRGSNATASLQPLPVRVRPRAPSQSKQPAATLHLSRQASNSSSASAKALASPTQCLVTRDEPPPLPEKLDVPPSPSTIVGVRASDAAAVLLLAGDAGHSRAASDGVPLDLLPQDQFRRLAKSSQLLANYLNDEGEGPSSSHQHGSSEADESTPEASSDTHYLRPPSPPPNLELNLPPSSPLRFTFDGDELHVLDEDEQPSEDSSAAQQTARSGEPSVASYDTAPPSSPGREVASPEPRSRSRAGARTPDARRSHRSSKRLSGVPRVRRAAYFRGSKPPMPPRPNVGSALSVRAQAPVDAGDSSSSSSSSFTDEEDDEGREPSMPGTLRAASPRFSRREKVRLELQRKERNRARVDALHSLEGMGKQRSAEQTCDTDLTSSAAARSDDEATWDSESESSALAFNTELLLKVQGALPTLVPGTSATDLPAPPTGAHGGPFVTPKPPRKLVAPPEGARLEHEQRGLRDLEDAERAREYARSLHVDQPTPGRFAADVGVAP